MRFHYLNAPDIESSGGENMSDMERQTVIETITDLKDSIGNANLLNKSLKATVESFQFQLEMTNRNAGKSHGLIEELQAVINDLQKTLVEKDHEIADLKDLSNRHNKMGFGNKSTSRRHKKPVWKKTREKN